MLALALGPEAHAGWIDRLARVAIEAGEHGGGVAGSASKLTRLGAPAFEDAAHLVAKLPKTENAASLAVHLTPEGHWKFASREGEIFTAATPEELARMPTALLPPGETPTLALYLSEDAVFTGGTSRLSELPETAKLHLVSGTKSFPLFRDGKSTYAELRPGVRLSLTSPGAFTEGVAYLSRSLNRSNVRILALDPSGPKTLPSVPRFDPAGGTALVDSVDPASLSEALSRIHGQTALITGSIEGDVLRFVPASGGEQKLFVADLIRSAEAADVNLVLLNSAGPRQPGGTNWLWQTVKVANIDEAMARATNADFLAALAGTGKPLVVTTTESASSRIVVTVKPVEEGVTAPIEGTWSEWSGEVTGHVPVRAIEIFARDKAEDDERDARFIPGVPSGVQFALLGSMIMGLIAWQISWDWWSRIWPAEERAQYASATGHLLARGVRGLAYVLIWAPLVGVPAFIWAIVLQVAYALTAPMRAYRWIRARTQSS